MTVDVLFSLYECVKCNERTAVAYMPRLREWQVRSVRDMGHVLARVACDKAGLPCVFCGGGLSEVSASSFYMLAENGDWITISQPASSEFRKN